MALDTLFVLIVVLTQAWGRPANVTLDVPYHRQFTDFSCGDASLEMVLDYYGKVLIFKTEYNKNSFR
jgi:hypothetical protein